MRKEQQILRQIFDAAIMAVAPDTALQRHLHVEKGKWLCSGERRWQLEGRRIFVFGAGKGVSPMAQAVEDLLGDSIEDGLVVVKYDHDLPLQRIRQVQAGHPVPDENGVLAARQILQMAAACTAQDLVLCLLTGGASALTPAPGTGMGLEDLQAVTQLLLSCGATIQELNAVRKHLSVFSGGQLARAVNGAQLCSVIVSDVVGDPLDVIASGPTAPDPTTFADCAEIIRRFNLENRLPAAVRQHLALGLDGKIPETPKPGDPLFERVDNILAATNRQALEAAAQAAEACGYEPCILTDRMTGEARVRAADLVAEAKVRQGHLDSSGRGICLLAGGETTVTITGKGKGGRNQEMALAAALELEGHTGICGLFAGTDGTDGPTDAAGGYAFADSVARMGGRSRAAEFLQANDSNSALTASGDLLWTGPTLTNVMDLSILLINL
ncbi:MAG: glycerate kinase [Desulfovibrio sp.]|nr:glycerate kinase [Desulfovibrio sp.]